MSLTGDPTQDLRPTHTVARTITTGVSTTDRCYSLDAGTLLHRIEIVQYLEWTCAGPFLSSVGRYELLDVTRRGTIAEITHTTICDETGPLVEEHPDLDVAGSTRPLR